MVPTPSPQASRRPPPTPPPAAATGAAAGVGAGVAVGTGVASAGAVSVAITAVITALAAPVASVGALVAILAAIGIGATVARAIVRIVTHTSPHPGRVIGPATSEVAAQAPYYRGAYLVHAAMRVQANVRGGMTLRQALDIERRFYAAHLHMQAKRFDAARAVDRLAKDGHVWLLWHLGTAKHHTPACVAANGHKFRADRKPTIGWPGSTHPGCNCWPSAATPLRKGQLTVNQVTAPLVALGLD